MTIVMMKKLCESSMPIGPNMASGHRLAKKDNLETEKQLPVTDLFAKIKPVVKSSNGIALSNPYTSYICPALM